MKPKHHMPFYGNDFFQAVEGQPGEFVAGYLRAIWHCWHHTSCGGLRDDAEFLRRLCRIEPEHWDAFAAFAFDNDKGFSLGEDGKWHQSRAAEEWKKAVERYDATSNRGKSGALARWKKSYNKTFRSNKNATNNA